MGCGGSAHRVAVAPLVEVEESAGGDVCLLKSVPTTGGTGEEKLILVKSVDDPASGESAVRPATPSTNGGDGAAADFFEDPETASNAASTEGGMPSPTKKRGKGNGNGNQALLPQEPGSPPTLSSADVQQPTKTQPALAADAQGSSAVPEPEKGDAAEPAKPAEAEQTPPKEDGVAVAAPMKEKETEKEKGEKPSEDDPATAKLVSKLERLETDLASQLASAGPMQKRAWRNKRAELVECFDEACAAAGPERKSALQERLEKLGAQLEGKPAAPQTANGAPKHSTQGPSPAGVVAG